jgi:hypothetical protein
VSADQKVGFAIEETVSGNTKTAKVTMEHGAAAGILISHLNSHMATIKSNGSSRTDVAITRKLNIHSHIKDCKAPTVVCENGLSANIVPFNTLTLWAQDFLQYAEDNCTPADQIRIGIRKCGTGNGFPADGNGNPITNVNYTCDDLGAQCVEIWALDKAGNADYCETLLAVQDNLEICPGSSDSITGRVITEQGIGVSDVSIEIDWGCTFCPPPLFPNLTDAFGYFAIDDNFPIADHFYILPEKDDNPHNGVTTYDLVLISKHILNTEPLDSPYKMISADANKSGSITSFDIVELRKLILGVYVELPNNTSWRFVDSSFVFPNPQNPFQTGFPDTIPLGNPSPYNFIGMKIGDVNNTAIPNVLSPAEERFDGTVYFDTEDREVQEGEVFELKFSASELLEGCQFTLETDGLEILEILPGENMDKDNFALFPKKSLLNMAWEAGGRAHFTLKLKAQKTGALREMLRLSDQITKTEAYPITPSLYHSITKSRIALRFGNSNPQFELFQNQPNPFAEKTAITFQLPEASQAVLTVLDGNGKILWSKSSDWPAGMNTVEIDLTGLSVAGVLYYKLETPEKSAVRKMVRI